MLEIQAAESVLDMTRLADVLRLQDKCEEAIRCTARHYQYAKGKHAESHHVLYRMNSLASNLSDL
jgi:hypothetical protein